MSTRTRRIRLVALVTALLVTPAMFAAHIDPHALNNRKSKSTKVSETQRTRRRMHHLASSRGTVARPAVHRAIGSNASLEGGARVERISTTTHRRNYQERFYRNSLAEGIAAGDNTDGEDPVVRQAAIDALGNMNGTVVAIEPTSGRVLAMVNQKLALSSGAQPCSTIKLSVALAALSDGLITR